MTPIREIEKRYGSRALVAAILIALPAIAAGHKGAGKGLVLGTLFSVLNFALMGELLPFRVGKSRRWIYFYSLFSLGLRCALLSVPLVAAIKFDGISIFTVVFGIFMVQLVIFTDHFFRLFNFSR